MHMGELMISYIEIPIYRLEDYDESEWDGDVETYREHALRGNIPQAFVDDDVIDKLKKYIGTRCDKIIIEYP